MDSIRNSSLSDDEKMEQIKTMRENNRKAMEDVLTPEQRSKMQEMRKQQIARQGCNFLWPVVGLQERRYIVYIPAWDRSSGLCGR